VRQEYYYFPLSVHLVTFGKIGTGIHSERADDGVGFVAERAIDDERGIGATSDTNDTDVGEEVHHVHVPIDNNTLNKMNLVQLKNELKLRQQSLSAPLANAQKCFTSLIK
jgi:hypothetical protein